MQGVFIFIDQHRYQSTQLKLTVSKWLNVSIFPIPNPATLWTSYQVFFKFLVTQNGFEKKTEVHFMRYDIIKKVSSGQDRHYVKSLGILMH